MFLLSAMEIAGGSEVYIMAMRVEEADRRKCCIYSAMQELEK